MYIYKTTNLKNGKIYVGQSIKNPEDSINYIGSGKLLLKAISKYKFKNFKKEILEICETKEELNKKEKFWIKELKSLYLENGYNISKGGIFGDIISNNPNKKKIAKKISKSNFGENNPMFGISMKQRLINKHGKVKAKKLYLQFKEKQRLRHLDSNYINPSKLKEVKRKISKANTGINNGNASNWKLILEDKNSILIKGGIKRNLLLYNLDYQQFKKISDNEFIHKSKSIKLIKIPKDI